eukprot:6206584-Pleurochrysis_carterae.AAC.4
MPRKHEPLYMPSGQTCNAQDTSYPDAGERPGSADDGVPRDNKAKTPGSLPGKQEAMSSLASPGAQMRSCERGHVRRVTNSDAKARTGESSAATSAVAEKRAPLATSFCNTSRSLASIAARACAESAAASAPHRTPCARFHRSSAEQSNGGNQFIVFFKLCAKQVPARLLGARSCLAAMPAPWWLPLHQ